VSCGEQATIDEITKKMQEKYSPLVISDGVAECYHRGKLSKYISRLNPDDNSKDVAGSPRHMYVTELEWLDDCNLSDSKSSISSSGPTVSSEVHHYKVNTHYHEADYLTTPVLCLRYDTKEKMYLFRNLQEVERLLGITEFIVMRICRKRQAHTRNLVFQWYHPADEASSSQHSAGVSPVTSSMTQSQDILENIRNNMNQYPSDVIYDIVYTNYVSQEFQADQKKCHFMLKSLSGPSGYTGGASSTSTEKFALVDKIYAACQVLDFMSYNLGW
jgi:hypothetical protein